MIHRPDPNGLIVITQPPHALMAGQIARSWGNRQFGDIAPRAETCTAAALHDLGWLAWEVSPTLNPQTGHPHAFDQIGQAAHLEIWSRGPRLAIAFGRYVALLVSLHGSSLFYLRSHGHKPPSAAFESFLTSQRALQKDLIASLNADANIARYGSGESIARNQGVIRACDAISLYLCMGLDRERTIPDIPSANGSITLTLTAEKDRPTEARLHPWPFAEPVVPLTVEGRRLPQVFSSTDELHEALAQAPWVALSMRLTPA
ncbi:MAG: DUF3891 family protein [Candidatus Omnitrophica bacterium]|nr:DUF3891 family protein [Candidatus Omnitrophota bacterium]